MEASSIVLVVPKPGRRGSYPGALVLYPFCLQCGRQRPQRGSLGGDRLFWLLCHLVMAWQDGLGLYHGGPLSLAAFAHLRAHRGNFKEDPQYEAASRPVGSTQGQ
ncbi:hypothetical protein Z043_110932, partial [Scleropages formosus]